MKKIFVLLILTIPFVLQFCSSSKNVVNKKIVMQKINYTNNIQPIIMAKCTPCHIPPQGNKKPYNTYASVKDDADDIIRRISLNPTDRGFMPQRHPKLSDSTINVFVQWKTDGLMEK